jgi:hypothetical protein
MASKIRSIQQAMDKRAGAEINTTLGALYESAEALQTLSNERLPSRLAFTMARILKTVQSELETFHETRLKLCQQYGALNESQTQYVFPDASSQEAFEKEWLQLRALPVTIKGTQIKINDLQGISISAAALMALSWLIVE